MSRYINFLDYGHHGLYCKCAACFARDKRKEQRDNEYYIRQLIKQEKERREGK